MSVTPTPITLRPTATNPDNGLAGWTLVSGATAGQCLNDNSDASYVQLAANANIANAPFYRQYFDASGLSGLPALSQVRYMVGRLRWQGLADSAGADVVVTFGEGHSAGTISSYSYDTVSLGPAAGINTKPFTQFSDFAYDITQATNYQYGVAVYPQTSAGTLTTGQGIRMMEAYFDVYYNQVPTCVPAIAGGGVNGSLTPQITWTYADPENDQQERYRVAIYRSADVTAAGGGFDPWATLTNAINGYTPAWFSGGTWARTQQYGSSLSDWNTSTTSSANQVTVDAGALKAGVAYKVFVGVGDVGSGSRFSTNQTANLTINIDPVLMPTLCLLPNGAANVSTATTHGGVSFNPATGQIDSLIVGVRSNLLPQRDAAFESGLNGNIGNWVISGGGTFAASTAQPFFGTACIRLTADGTGTGHCIATSAKVAFGDPGLVSVTGHPLYMFQVHVRPVAAIASPGEVVTLKVRFYDKNNTLLTDQPVTSQHICNTSIAGNQYKKIWLLCQVPVTATQCDMVLDIGPCGAAKAYDIDGAAITPFQFNLADNSSFESSSPVMWNNQVGAGGTIAVPNIEAAPEWAGGSYDALCTSVGNSTAYLAPADKTGVRIRYGHEGGSKFILSASGKGTTNILNVQLEPGGTGSFVPTTAWLRYSALIDASGFAAGSDAAPVYGIWGTNSAGTLSVDNVSCEPVMQFVNGNMDSGTSGNKLPTTVNLNGSTHLGWVWETIDPDTNTNAFWTNLKSQSGAISLRLNVGAGSTATTQASQYFSVAGWGAIQGQFVAQWQNCVWWEAVIQQFDHGGNLVQANIIYINAGTSNTAWTPVPFAVAVNSQAAYAKILFYVNGLFFGVTRPDTSSQSIVWIDSVSITVPSAQVYGTTMYSGPTSAAFGSLVNYSALPTGQPFVPTTTPSYSIGAGEAIWFAGLLSDGKALFGTQPLTVNPLSPTADHCELDIFDPSANTWSQVIVPTSTHLNTAVIPGGVVGGNEVADVAISGTSAYWLSSGIVFNWNTAVTGVYPVLGVLTKPGTVWSINRSYRAEDIKASNPGADTATLWPQVTDKYGNTYYDACGPAEMDVTAGPAAGYVVMTHYFPTPASGTAVQTYPNVHSGGISVIDPATGTLKATYRIPDMIHANGRLLQMTPRGIECDPSASTTTDVRFTVIYDAYYRDGSGNAGHPIQEFSVNTTTTPFTITPKSVPVLPDPNGVVTGSGAMVADPNVIAYDSSGNLYVPSNNQGATGLATLNCPGTAVFKKTGSGTLENFASVTTFPNWATDGHVYFPVTPTFFISNGRTSYVLSVGTDATNLRVYESGANGILSAITWTAGLNLGSTLMLGTSPPTRTIDQGTFEPASNLLSANDSSFETSVAGWLGIGNSTLSQVTPPVAAPAGTKAMQMSSIAAGSMSSELVSADYIPVVPGGTYSCSMQVLTQVSARSCRINLHWFDSTRTSISVSVGASTADNTTTWTTISLSGVVAPANAAYVATQIDCLSTAAANEVHYVDNVQLSITAAPGAVPTADWVPNAASCTLATSTTQAHAGTWSMTMTATSTNTMKATTPTGTSAFAVTQGQQYQITAWFRASTTTAKCYLVPYFYDSAGNFISNNTNSAVPATYTKSITDTTSGWTQTYTTFDPPTNASFVAVGLFIESSTLGAVHYVDDVVLQTLPYSVTAVDLLFTPLRSSLVNSTYGLSTVKPAVDTANNRLWIPLIQSQIPGSPYSTSTTPVSVTQWLYKVAITAGASPPSQTNGPTQWIDGGWSAGGTVGAILGAPTAGVVALQRSSDRSTWSYVRGTQGANPKLGGSSPAWGAFGPYFKLAFDDYEWPTINVDATSQTFYYRAIGQYTQGVNVFTSPAGRDYTITATPPLAITEWLLIDPLNNANNYTVHLKSLKFQTDETAQVFTPLGRSRKVIVADELLGDTITLTVFCWTNADFTNIQKVINQQAALVLRSPDGEMWYVRATKRTRERTWTGAPYAKGALRTVTVTFETVDVLG